MARADAPATAVAPERSGEGLRVEMVDPSRAPAAEWDALADAAGASPFTRPGYVDAWIAGFGDGVRPRVLLTRRDGELRGVACLAERGRRLRALVNDEAHEAPLVARDPVAMAELADALLAHGASRVDVGPLHEASGAHAALEGAAAGRGHRALTRTALRCPVVAAEGGWEDYRASRSRNTRHKADRCRRRLEEAGTAAFEVHDGRTALDALLAEGLRVEASGWKGRAGTAVASREDTRRYYSALARWASREGWLRLSFLRLDGRAIAFGYGIESGGRHVLLKIGVDPAFARLSPGTLLLEDLIRRCFTGGCPLFDFAGEAEAYKLAWATAVVEHLEIAAFAPSPGGRLALAAEAARRRAAAIRRAYRRPHVQDHPGTEER